MMQDLHINAYYLPKFPGYATESWSLMREHTDIVTLRCELKEKFSETEGFENMTIEAWTHEINARLQAMTVSISTYVNCDGNKQILAALENEADESAPSYHKYLAILARRVETFFTWMTRPGGRLRRVQIDLGNIIDCFQSGSGIAGRYKVAQLMAMVVRKGILLQASRITAGCKHYVSVKSPAPSDQEVEDGKPNLEAMVTVFSFEKIDNGSIVPSKDDLEWNGRCSHQDAMEQFEAPFRRDLVETRERMQQKQDSRLDFIMIECAPGSDTLKIWTICDLNKNGPRRHP